MNSKELSISTGVTPRYVRLVTKQAVDRGLEVVNIRGERYQFSLISSAETRGKAYEYKVVRTINISRKPKRRISDNFKIDPQALPRFADINKPTIQEKLNIVQFINTTKHPISHIAQLYYEKYDSKASPQSITAKFKRWVKLFKTKGLKSLEDKRGGKNFKADLDLVKRAILGAGSKHYTTAYSFYCRLYAETHNLKLDYRNLSADISESTFNRSVKHIIKTQPLIKEYTRLGKDTFTYAEPSFGSEWAYPNEQWEIDATKIDIMCKIPDKDDEPDFINKKATADFYLKRAQLIRVIDNKTGASVCGLFMSANSYANVRLLYKAFKKLGMPERIKSDNGKDYVSKHMQQVLFDLGINYIKIPKGRPDRNGKIENSHKTLQHSYQFESLPGFIGHDVDQRQHIENEAATKLEKLSGVQTHLKDDFMWWWEAENWIDNFLAHKDKNKYNEHPQESIDFAEIYRLLGKKTNKTVAKEGIRHCNSYFTSLELLQEGKLIIGDKVTVRENIDDSNKLFLFKGSEYIGEIKDRDAIRDGEGLTVEEIKATKKAYRKQHVKKVRAITNQAQKEFKEHQNAMRDEYLDIEAQQIKVKKETKNTEEEQIRDKHSKFVLELVG